MDFDELDLANSKHASPGQFPLDKSKKARLNRTSNHRFGGAPPTSEIFRQTSFT